MVKMQILQLVLLMAASSLRIFFYFHNYKDFSVRNRQPSSPGRGEASTPALVKTDSSPHAVDAKERTDHDADSLVDVEYV